MLRFLIHRPVAVLMTTAALLIFAVLAIRDLPVSLLPDTDVPEIVIKVQYANASPESIERNILRPIRESMQTLNGLTNIESRAASESGQIRLLFDYGQPMDLLYVEINEKIDRLSGSFPNNMDRPLVIRLNASDIPVIRLQITPKISGQFTDVSDLAEAVIKKRIEQLEGISLVDINGMRKRNISVIPNEQKLVALGVDEKSILEAIQTANRELGAISVKDGQYRYYLRLANRLTSAEDILKLPVKLGEKDYVPLERLASVESGVEKPNGLHLFQREEAIVMNIHKQGQARMNSVIPQVYEAVKIFENDFPELDFALTQDQSVMLNTGIDNLSTSLLFGGSFAFLVLFLFMGNYRIPIIMGLSLPLSLLISFLFFNWLNISINIISLSGLALGLGMLIDNAIIVLDNISRKRSEGMSLIEACVNGTNEIMSALISSVLTTLAVFVPLVFLSGVAGALFYDQAVAVGVILGVSLLVAFILLPLLYRLFFTNKSDQQKESRLYVWILRRYNQVFDRLFKRAGLSFLLLFLLIPFAIWMGSWLPVSGLPEVNKNDIMVNIDWNEPIDIVVSQARLRQLMDETNLAYSVSEADIGLSQFILQADESGIQEVQWYMLFDDKKQSEAARKTLQMTLKNQFPEARLEIIPAPNAFDHIFSNTEEPMSIRWRQAKTNRNLSLEQVIQQMESIPLSEKRAGESLEQQASLSLKPDYAQLRSLGISYDEFIEKINRLFGNYLITEINSSDYTLPVQLAGNEQILRERLKSTYISNNKGEKRQQYPLTALAKIEYSTDFKYINADASGPFHAVHIPVTDPKHIQEQLNPWAKAQSVIYELTGQYFKDQETIKQLIFILIIAIAMLYFILSAQFENFIQPLIVVTTLPLGLGGAFLFLYLADESLNIMSGIGLVVMLGIIVNDSILKIDIINRELKKALEEGVERNQALLSAIHQGGIVRLKPIIMTSVTTMLALLPLLFASGLGADLQKPLVISVLGGLTIGTLASLYYVPLAYLWVYKLVKVKK